MDGFKRSGIPIQSHKSCLVASIQIDLAKTQMKLFQDELLHSILEQKGLKGVIFDLSARNIIDLDEFNELRKLVDIVRLMGFDTVFMGLKPTVISSLIIMNANSDGITGVMSLDKAIDFLET